MTEEDQTFDWNFMLQVSVEIHHTFGYKGVFYKLLTELMKGFKNDRLCKRFLFAEYSNWTSLNGIPRIIDDTWSNTKETTHITKSYEKTFGQVVTLHSVWPRHRKIAAIFGVYRLFVRIMSCKTETTRFYLRGQAEDILNRGIRSTF